MKRRKRYSPALVLLKRRHRELLRYKYYLSIKIAQLDKVIGNIINKSLKALTVSREIDLRRKSDSRRYYRDKQKRLQAQKERLKTPEGRSHRRNWIKQYYHKNPEIFLARAKVKYALKIGELIRLDYCSRCFAITKPHAHHPDYSKALEVVWLCQPCHRFIHKGVEI